MQNVMPAGRLARFKIMSNRDKQIMPQREKESTQIKEFFLNDPDVTEHHVKIHKAEEWQIPQINYSLFEQKNKSSVMIIIGALIQFLRAPYIEDDFQKHNERREWRAKLGKKYEWFWEFYADNVLKGNVRARVVSALNVINDCYKGEMPQELSMLLKEIQEKAAIKFQKFDAIPTTEEKIAYMKQIKEQVFEFLTYLSV